MKKSKFLLRTGVCIIIIGLSILLANLTASLRGSTGSQNFSIPANGIYMVVIELQNRPYEIRILVPEEFNGTFCILNYEGIKKLTEGTKTPTLEQTLEGSILIDFKPNRRGAYMFLVESNVSENVSGSIGLVEKEAISQDLLVDSTIIILFGLAIILMAALSKHLSRHSNERHRTPKRDAHSVRPLNESKTRISEIDAQKIIVDRGTKEKRSLPRIVNSNRNK